MMTSTTTPALGPLVGAYGLVGHEERLLLVRDRDASAFRLPGGRVQPGESVEDALRRSVREQTDVDLAYLDFCATVELRDHTSPNGPALYELALLFDVTLAGPEAARSSEHELRWLTQADLHQVELRPAVIAERLRSDALTVEHPWWPHYS
ncbi:MULTISPECIES: NUDIX domain-containing protein [Actinomycetes]|uniref:NUDIX domain-containing protein n=3 Tax=Actinomycetes TaxID=1760 RepID=A0A8E1W753_9PSEU|nr:MULTISPECIES: NUDIX domain-containing protein [Actinomycetes]PEH77669.1 ADP-ribose pyrophosphatase [Nocardia sp. FDAARGOS_372]MBB2505056.1 NUDIX domain-containing protein [Amycolatopsis echigonensis]MBF6188748.1 NUDIX domain-containing protein [Nocardia farcinica]MBF6295588.1 NUDIX domain-containing protein [Nocardia farcinica]MCF6426159.1 NUDIX domain-containing protein [Amycolatopsis tucumanensis]